MSVLRKISILIVLVLVFSISMPLQGQAATGTWYTPKYQDAFCNTVSFYSASEGVYVGYKYPDLKSFNRCVTIYNQVMKPIVSTTYTDIGGSFHEGLMAVGHGKILDNGSFVYGYIDKTGKEVIPVKYYDVSNFKNNRAIVHQEDGNNVTTLVIDKTGKVIFQFNYYISGEVGDDFIHFDASDVQTVDQPDEDGNLFYDFNGKNISMSDIEETYPDVQYDEFWVRMVDSKRYNSSEAGAFNAKYASLYDDSIYLGNGFFKVSKKGVDIHSIVDKNNKIIVPMGDIEITPILTETSQFFVVKDNGAKKLLSAIYSPTGKVLVKGDYRVFYAGNGGVYYYRAPDKGWGLISLTGTPIVKFSTNFLSSFDYNSGELDGESDFYVFVPDQYTTFYTTTNFNVKADTTHLKAILAQANACLKKMSVKGYTTLSEYTKIKNKLIKYIGYATTLIASKTPTWIDVSSIESELLLCATQTVPGDDKADN